MAEQERDGEHSLGPTEELLAREQAEAMARSQQPAPESVNAEARSANPAFAPAHQTEADQAQEQEQRKQEEQEQREWEAKRDGPRQDQAQGQEQAPGWLQAPQDEGIISHPTPDTSPVSPGKEQHQQAVAEETGERSGGMKRTIGTRTQLGALVTLDGVYVVPRYQTVIKETPMQDKVSYMRQLAKEQGSGRQQGQQEQEKGKDRDRDRER